eukprot:GHVS01068427.1.p1 GENE.GHVS01068427.1~~GHVS01068427.1.p1  ORF type:complete len:300 (+),score=17.64 GHVS01068427.1:502-1401(+)
MISLDNIFNTNRILSTTATPHMCGNKDRACKHCGALFWEAESTTSGTKSNLLFGSFCCNNGFLILELFPPPPPLLYSLYTSNDSTSIFFRTFIRKFNTSLSMAAFVTSRQTSAYTPTIIIEGQVQRFVGSLYPNINDAPLSLQTYMIPIINCPIVSSIHTSPASPQLEKATYLLSTLQKVLLQHNSYIRSYLSIHEAIESGGIPAPTYLRIGLHADKKPAAGHPGCVNLPSNTEFALLTPTQQSGSKRLVITDLRSGGKSSSLRLLDETHRSYDPLQYVLLFPYGTDGWCQIILPTDAM